MVVVALAADEQKEANLEFLENSLTLF